LRDLSKVDEMSEIYVELKIRLKLHCKKHYVQYASYILSEYSGIGSVRASYLTVKQFESIRKKRKGTLYCDNDLVISALLALYTSQHREEVADDIAESIKELEERKIPTKTAKHVARILAFGKGVASARCDRFVRLLKLLNERDVKIGFGKEASVVAFAALIDIPDERLADSIAEVNNYFVPNKELTREVGAVKLTMYAILLACGELISEIEDASLLLVKEATLANILSLEMSRHNKHI